MDVPKRIIEKYRGLTKDGRVFPVPNNGSCNKILKEIGSHWLFYSHYPRHPVEIKKNRIGQNSRLKNAKEDVNDALNKASNKIEDSADKVKDAWKETKKDVQQGTEKVKKGIKKDYNKAKNEVKKQLD